MQAIFQGMLEKDVGPVLISMCSPMGFEFVFLVCCCLQAPYFDFFLQSFAKMLSAPCALKFSWASFFPVVVPLVYLSNNGVLKMKFH